MGDNIRNFMNESIMVQGDSIMEGVRTKAETGVNGKNSRNKVRFSRPHHRDAFQLDGGGNGGAPAPLK